VARGHRQGNRGRLAWNSKTANRGRKGAYGKRRHFMTEAEARAKIQRNATLVVVPPKAEEAAPAAAAPKAETKTK
jgi:hypothetical protein